MPRVNKVQMIGFKIKELHVTGQDHNLTWDDICGDDEYVHKSPMECSRRSQTAKSDLEKGLQMKGGVGILTRPGRGENLLALNTFSSRNTRAWLGFPTPQR